MDKFDPLKGYRGERPEALRRSMEKLREAEAEVSETSPYKRMMIGIMAERLIAGLGEAGDAERVLHAVIQRAEAEVRENQRLLMAIPDLTSEAARIVHFDARVAAGIVTWLNEMIRDGAAAANQLREAAEENDDPEV